MSSRSGKKRRKVQHLSKDDVYGGMLKDDRVNRATDGLPKFKPDPPHPRFRRRL